MQKLGERRQWFPLNRFCVQKLIKNRLVRKPDDTKHRVVKKSRCTIEPEQSCSCVKKSKQRRWSGHDCTSRVVVGWVDYPTCQVLAHSMNSSCSVRGVDCEHHKDGEVVNQQIYSTDWAKSHTKEVFSRRPEAGGDIRQLLKGPGEEIRSRSVQTMSDWWWRWRRNVSFSISASLSLFSALTLYSHAHLWSIKLSMNLPTVCSPRSETWGREFPYYKTVLWIRPINAFLSTA